MASLLDSVRAALRRPKNTTDAIAAAVELARKALDDAKAAVERQAKVVAASFMDDDATRAAARAALRDARDAAEDAELILREAEKRHAAALAADERARRVALRASAQEQARAAATAIETKYPRLCREMIALVGELATAQQAVVTSNAQPVDGEEPILDPEFMARSIPGQQREIVSETEVVLWAALGADRPLDVQDNVYAVGRGWGRRSGDLEPCYQRRRFKRTEYRELTHGTFPLPLAAALQLPAVKGAGMLWGNSHPVGAHPALAAAVLGAAEPGAVLGTIAALEAAAVAKPAKPAERPIKIEWTGLDFVTEANPVAA